MMTQAHSRFIVVPVSIVRLMAASSPTSAPVPVSQTALDVDVLEHMIHAFRHAALTVKDGHGWQSRLALYRAGLAVLHEA